MLNKAASSVLKCLCRFKGRGVIINEHTLNPEETRRHVEVLSRHFEFIHPDDLSFKLQNPSKRPFCLLTFDDGKKSNASQAGPELYRMGVPAIFFVTTGFLDSGELMWFDRYQNAITTLGHVPQGFERETLKRLPFALLEERLNRLCAESPSAAWTNSEDFKPMSWDEVRHLHKSGFAIGAHGVKHSILTRERRETAFSEIIESMSKVATETGTACRAFAFPNGNFTAELAQHAVQRGASMVVTTEPAWVTKEDPFWRLPRIQIHSRDSASKIMMKISVAGIEGILSNPDGTGRAYLLSRRIARQVRPQTG